MTNSRHRVFRRTAAVTELPAEECDLSQLVTPFDRDCVERTLSDVRHLRSSIVQHGKEVAQ